MQISKIDYDTIMLSAVRAYEREDVLFKASKSESTAEYVMQWFQPYADRLIARSKGLPRAKRELASTFFFQRFSKIVL